MSNNAVTTILGVADRLAAKGHPRARELRRIAQMLTADVMGGQDGPIGEFTSAGDTNFDPSQGDMQVNTMKSGAEDEGSMSVSQGDGGGEPTHHGGHPMIEKFVDDGSGMDGGSQMMVDDRVIHTLTCTLKAPQEVSEAKMMNYILGIGPELNVDVDSFKWARSDPKPAGGGNSQR